MMKTGILILALCCGSSAVFANFASFQASSSHGKLLLVNGVDRLLLSDGVSKLCLSDGC